MVSMRIAIFTGAGCSFAFGFPLTGQFFPEIRRILRRRTSSPAQSLKKFLGGLYPGYEVVPDGDLPLITELLSMIDSSILSSAALGPRDGVTNLRQHRRQLEQLIYDVLRWEEAYVPGDPQQKRLIKMARWMLALYQEHQLGLISTNYDMALEWTLRGDGDGIARWLSDEELERSFDLGFAWRHPSPRITKVVPRPQFARFACYKLHGSFDLLRCPLCDHIYFNRYGSIVRQAMRSRLDENNTCHCGYGPLELMLVTPSLVRDIRDSTLLEVWRHAIEFLRGADHWIFVGYALPSEDVAIRTLIVRALQGHKSVPAVTVIQFGDDARKPYRLMFPDGVYEAAGTETFIDSVDPAAPLRSFLQYRSSLRPI